MRIAPSSESIYRKSCNTDWEENALPKLPPPEAPLYSVLRAQHSQCSVSEQQQQEMALEVLPLPARVLSPSFEPSHLAGPEISADSLWYADWHIRNCITQGPH